MFRQHKLLLVVALSGVAIAAATLRPAANAQSGQALVFAERACLDYGVTPHTAPFESCVSGPHAPSIAASRTSPTCRRAGRAKPATPACPTAWRRKRWVIVSASPRQDRPAHEQEDADPLRAALPTSKAAVRSG